MEILTFKDYPSYFIKRKKEWHKGLSGHVLIIGGAPGFLGAPIMAGMAALRVGAGCVSIATHPQHAPLASVSCPEIMSHGIQDLNEIETLLAKVNFIAIGPGLQKAAWGKTLFHSVLTLLGKPLLLDADALNLLAERPQKNDNWILTPHVGEAARLLHCQPTNIEEDRIKAATAIQEKYGGVCVLKGAGSLVVSSPFIKYCDRGNPGMSVAGMGDVLTGIIASLCAQGGNLLEAAALGVLIHATAGDLAVREQGEKGLLATDLMPYLRKVANQGDLTT